MDSISIPFTDTAETDMRIGIWGGLASGKTTYIGALDLARLRAPDGDWVLDGMDRDFPGSTDFIVETTRTLLRREFPETTTDPNGRSYGYILSGELTPESIKTLSQMVDMPHLAGRIANLFGRSKPVSFSLHLKDYPGGKYIDTLDHDDEIWDYLAGCDGLIYLLDPERELDEHGNPLDPAVHMDNDGNPIQTNFDYLQRSIKLLRGKMRHNNALVNNRLPHYLAACVSKFDMAPVFSRLVEADLIDSTDKIWPYVKVRDTEAAFGVIASDITREEIRRSFLKDRIEYFMMSSIGFNCDASGRPNFGYTDSNGITRGDYANSVMTTDGPRIRGDVRPVNLLEPIIWMYTKYLADHASKVGSRPRRR